MDQSLTLINAQIQFLDTRLGLVHIPLTLYPHFIQPILRLLALTGYEGETDTGEIRRPWQFAYPFANISVTTVECSIVCPRHLINELFTPILAGLTPSNASSVSISREDFVVIQVGGEGEEAGQRVLDLTAPLALAGISIFFITTYTSDYILVPQKSRHAVVSALENRGFAFQNTTNGHSQMTNISSPLAHNRNPSSPISFEALPSTPPPTTIPELQARTFATLKKNNIHPIDTATTVQNSAGHRADRATQSMLTHCITSCLLSVPPPHFLALTLTDTEPVSLSLDTALLSHFPNRGVDVLLSADELVVPIMLDLRTLPAESTGIVCGVAGRLIERLGKKVGGGFNMSYLSTVRAGNVIVGVDEVEEAMEALRGVVPEVATQETEVKGLGVQAGTGTGTREMPVSGYGLRHTRTRSLEEGLEGMSL